MESSLHRRIHDLAYPLALLALGIAAWLGYRALGRGRDKLPLERFDERPTTAPVIEPSAVSPSSIVFRSVTLKRGQQFEIAIDPRLPDPISQGLDAGDGWVFDDFGLLLDVLQPGDMVLDLGGHVGTFALAAAALGCRVVCVEAAPENVALLQASVARNGLANLQVVHGAVGDREGTLQFLPHGPWGTIASDAVLASPAMIYADDHAPVDVPALTVDSLLDRLGWQRVDYIKMDIEGSEVAALRGMIRLQARPDAPTLLYESNGYALNFAGESPTSLATLLRERGYSVYRVEPGRLIPVQPDEIQYVCVANCLAIKGELPSLGRWRIVSPPAHDEIVRAIMHARASTWRHDRLYLARTLAEAGDSLLTHPDIRHTLSLLRTDPDPAVRAAAAWSAPIP